MNQQIERRQFGLLDVKAVGDAAGSFSGYGAIFGNIDSYGEKIEKGAFAKSLNEWKGKGKWPKMLLQHGGWGITADDMVPVGQWDEMSEDSKGLKVAGHLFAMNTERGQYVYEGLKSGELDSLSIGFETIEAGSEVVDGDPIRLLTEIKLWEVSIVTFPANDKAKISSVKGLTLNQWREFEDVLREEGMSRSNSRMAVSILKKHLLQCEAGDPISTLRDEGVPENEAGELLRLLSQDIDKTWAATFRV